MENTEGGGASFPPSAASRQSPEANDVMASGSPRRPAGRQRMPAVSGTQPGFRPSASRGELPPSKEGRRESGGGGGNRS